MWEILGRVELKPRTYRFCHRGAGQPSYGSVTSVCLYLCTYKRLMHVFGVWTRCIVACTHDVSSLFMLNLNNQTTLDGLVEPMRPPIKHTSQSNEHTTCLFYLGYVQPRYYIAILQALDTPKKHLHTT